MYILKNKPYRYTREVVKNTTAVGLRDSLMHQSRDLTITWELAVELEGHLEAAEMRIAAYEKIILDSILSKKPPSA